MKAFLQELAEEIYKNHADLSKITVVFPNRRAALYFRKYLGESISQPVFSPKLLAFEDFVTGLSPWQVPDKLELVFRLHQVYYKVMGRDAEPFDQFFMWGEMLLRDFDEADKYLINAKNLFSDLRYLKELDSGLDYLTEEQIAFLESFWSNLDSEQSVNKQKFIDIWRRLYSLYQSFKDSLSKEGLAYEGMLHRAIAEDIDSGKILLPYPVGGEKCLWFAGFNALTKAEETIISFAVEQGMAQVRWDTDQYYVNDVQQEAGSFFRSHMEHPVLRKTFSSNVPDFFRQEKKARLFSAAQPVGQVKAMAQILADELQKGLIPEETVIILPDEKLLSPVLHSISGELEKFNVTMGFPLASSPVYNLVEILIELQTSSRKDFFNFHQAQAVLSHPYVTAAGAATVHSKIKEIIKHNWVSVPKEFLSSELRLHELVFSRPESITRYTLDILNEIADLPALEGVDREYVLKGIQLLNRLDAVWSPDSTELTTNQLKSFLRLFRQYARLEKIPFAGEPLKGLQVMGVLESRNLDFKNVFILSLNEGMLPSLSNSGSYIPYNIRRAYGLPTPEHQGSIYAYLFYRAIQRSQNIFLFYNSEPDVLGQGEMSRYLQQLLYESQLTVERHVLHNTAEPRQPQPIIIHKDENVLRALARLNEGNLRSRGLSPSALNIYLECKLRFYFQYLERIREPLKVEEEIDARVLGNILHVVMEHFYRHLTERKKSKLIEHGDFDKAEQLIERFIDDAFIKNYYLDPGHKVIYEGQRVVVREVVKSFALRITEVDREQTPFIVEALEQNGWMYNMKISHAPGFVALGGTIDRVDRKGDEIRVIDYKTGKDELKFRSIASLFSREGDRNKAAFQTLLYALLYQNNNLLNGERIVPGLINRNNLFDDDFYFGLKMDGEYLLDAASVFQEFESYLQRLLEEIFDPNEVFDQTNKEEACKICPYKGICYR